MNARNEHFLICQYLICYIMSDGTFRRWAITSNEYFGKFHFKTCAVNQLFKCMDKRRVQRGMGKLYSHSRFWQAHCKILVRCKPVRAHCGFTVEFTEICRPKLLAYVNSVPDCIYIEVICSICVACTVTAVDRCDTIVSGASLYGWKLRLRQMNIELEFLKAALVLYIVRTIISVNR